MKIMIIQFLAFVLTAALFACTTASSSAPIVETKAAAPAEPAVPAKGTETAVFAGGCFWGVEAVFEHVKGVTDAVSGYAGGSMPHPSYEQVSNGDTGYAESVRVT